MNATEYVEYVRQIQDSCHRMRVRFDWIRFADGEVEVRMSRHVPSGITYGLRLFLGGIKCRFVLWCFHRALKQAEGGGIDRPYLIDVARRILCPNMETQ